MPSNEPEPEVGIEEQPGPKVAAPAWDVPPEDMEEDIGADGAEPLVPESSFPPQAVSASPRVTAAAAAPPVRRRVLEFIVLPSIGVGLS